MKQLNLLLAFLLFSLELYSQAPNSFNYQAVLRDASGNIKSSVNANIRIDILQGSATGTIVFAETFAAHTNAFGLINLEIGKGTLVSGNFNTIDWSSGPYFIAISVDGIAMNTSQLLSVPYAIYASKAGNGFSGNYNDLTNKPTFNKWDKDSTDNVIITGAQTIAGNKTFTGTTTVPTPVNATDAATKAYVDALLKKIEVLELVNEGFTDPRDGNHYKVVKIGNQVWMAENLKYLPSVVGAAAGSSTIQYYYVSGYDGTVVADAKAIANYATYGVLYNWPAVMNGAVSSTAIPSGVQGVCPTGWHLPSDAEWSELTTYLLELSVAGGKLKETGTTHWNSPNTGATNETGFTSLPGGLRFSNGMFTNIGSLGYWWSATELSASNAHFRIMHYDGNNVDRGSNFKELGLSARCVRD